MADVVSDAEVVPQVLTEIQAGEGLSLSAAGRLFPGHRGGKSVDPSTVFRWVTKGTRAPNGVSVKLEAVRVGVRWLTSRGAIARFVAALTDASTPAPESQVKTHTSAGRNAAKKAGAALDAMGA